MTRYFLFERWTFGREISQQRTMYMYMFGLDQRLGVWGCFPVLTQKFYLFFAPFGIVLVQAVGFLFGLHVLSHRRRALELEHGS